MRRERGSAAVELVLVTPALVVLLLFVVFAGRLSSARADVDRAARDAARAASLARTPADAVSAAEATTRTALGQAVACARLDVSADVTDFSPGGTVTTSVTCTVALSDVAGLRVPGSTTLQSSFAERIDTFRAVRP